MHEISAILDAQAKWLWGRCRAMAAALVAPQRKEHWDAVEELTAELNQAVLVRFVKRTKDGWFDQAARVNREAQVRTLLQFCLLQEQKVQFAQRKKDKKGTSSWYDAEHDEDIDAVDAQEDQTVQHPVDGLVSAEMSDAAWAGVRQVVHPTRRLALLILSRPVELTEEDFTRASAHVASGRRFFVRDPAEAWTLFELARRDPRADDAAWWRRTVAEIIRFRLPLGEAAEPLVDDAVNALEKQLERGISDVQALLRSSGRGES